MPEKERERGSEDSQEMIEFEATIAGSYIGKISVPRGTTAEDLISEIKKLHNIDLANFFRVSLNDRHIEIVDGKLKENPTLTENGILSILKKIVGG